MENREIKIEDFISVEELNKMSEKELEIYKKVFLLNKQKLQGLTDSLKMVNSLRDKLDEV